MSSSIGRIALFSGMMLLAADPAGLKEARSRLGRMSESQRTRIEANWDQFQKLPAKEKQELRKLHAELENIGAEAVQLRTILNKYAIWLDTLSPADRKAIAEIESTEERLEKVSALIEAQHARLEKDLDPFFGPSNPNLREQDQSRLRRAYIAQIYKSFEELDTALKSKVSPLEASQLVALGNQPSLHRGALMLVLKRKYDIPLTVEIPPRLEEFFDERFSDTFFQLLGLKTYATATTEERRQLSEIIYKLLLFPKIPPRQELAFLESLTPEQREELRRIERIYGEVHAIFLRVLYYWDHPDKLPEPLQDTFQQTRSLRSTVPPQFPLSRRLDRPSRREGDRAPSEKVAPSP